MKRFLLFAAVLCLFFSFFPARAAVRFTDRKDPVPCAYSDFCQALSQYLNGQTPFFDPLFSAGYWTRVDSWDDRQIILVRTDRPEDDGLIQEVALYGSEENANAVMAFSLACMDSVAALTDRKAQKLLTQYHQTFVLERQEKNDLFAIGGEMYLENEGYSLAFGREDSPNPQYWAKITWKESLDTGITVPSAEDRISIPDGPDLETMMLTIHSLCRYPLDLFPFSLPEYEETEGFRLYSVEWDGCFLFLLADPDTQRVVNYAMVCEDGLTGSFWLHNIALLLAVTQVEIDSDDAARLLLLGGSSADWDHLSSLTPYAVYGDTVMYCLYDPATGLPMIYVGGWDI